MEIEDFRRPEDSGGDSDDDNDDEDEDDKASDSAHGEWSSLGRELPAKDEMKDMVAQPHAH